MSKNGAACEVAYMPHAVFLTGMDMAEGGMPDVCGREYNLMPDGRFA